jgi:hypothetical protein
MRSIHEFDGPSGSSPSSCWPSSHSGERCLVPVLERSSDEVGGWGWVTGVKDRLQYFPLLIHFKDFALLTGIQVEGIGGE